MIETLNDITEQLADELGVYGSHAECAPDGQCECRLCFTSSLRSRILEAVRIERAIALAPKEKYRKETKP